MKPVFVLFAGSTSSKVWWEYSFYSRTSTLQKLDFIKNLKKLGHVYTFTSTFWNVNYYYTRDTKEEQKRWNEIYKKYKPYSPDIDFNLEDLEDDAVCRKAYKDVRKKYGKKVKLIPIGHSYGGRLALLFSDMYKKECLCACTIDMQPENTFEGYKRELKNNIKNDSKMIKKYFNTNEKLHDVLFKIKNSIITKENVNKEINMVIKLIYNKYVQFRAKNYNNKLSVPTLFFKNIYHNKFITDKEIKKWDNDMNNGTNEEMKEIKMNNHNSMYKFKFFLNGFHLIWFNKKNSDDMINDIKYFIRS